MVKKVHVLWVGPIVGQISRSKWKLRLLKAVVLIKHPSAPGQLKIETINTEWMNAQELTSVIMATVEDKSRELGIDSTVAKASMIGKDLYF